MKLKKTPINLRQMAEVWTLIESILPEPEGIVIDYVQKMLDNVIAQNKYVELCKALVIMTGVSEDTITSLQGHEILTVLLECIQTHQVLDYAQWRKDDSRK